jgi:anti-sigma B factor antagonist
MTLEINTRQEQDVTVLELKGRILVGESGRLFHETVREHLDKGAKKILLNLGGVTYIDSVGVGELVGALVAIRKISGELKLAGLTPRVRDLLDITGVHKLVEITGDEAAGLQAFHK